MSTVDEVAAVRHGARLLDEKQPGWHNDVDVYTLDQSSATRCVLTQVYRKRVNPSGRHSDARYSADFVLSTGDDPAFLGFNTSARRSTGHTGLTEAWKAEIRYRRLPKTEAAPPAQGPKLLIDATDEELRVEVKRREIETKRVRPFKPGTILKFPNLTPIYVKQLDKTWCRVDPMDATVSSVAKIHDETDRYAGTNATILAGGRVD